MRVFMIYVPAVANTSVGRALIRNNMISYFGGMTIHPEVEGFWKHPLSGDLIKDFLHPWEIATHDEDAIKAYAEQIRVLTSQEVIYVREVGTAMFLSG